jgi:hypothetical protein
MGRVDAAFAVEDDAGFPETMPGSEKSSCAKARTRFSRAEALASVSADCVGADEFCDFEDRVDCVEAAFSAADDVALV